MEVVLRIAAENQYLVVRMKVYKANRTVCHTGILMRVLLMAYMQQGLYVSPLTELPWSLNCIEQSSIDFAHHRKNILTPLVLLLLDYIPHLSKNKAPGLLI